MLSLSNIYIQYGNRILLDSVNFVLKPGERVGLVGRNGAGKSTLLKIIASEMQMLGPRDGAGEAPVGTGDYVTAPRRAAPPPTRRAWPGRGLARTEDGRGGLVAKPPTATLPTRASHFREDARIAHPRGAPG